MIRAAAKNHEGVAVVVKPESYDAVCAELRRPAAQLSASTRHWLANEAFAQTARYDAAISRWFSARVRGLPRTPGGRLREGARPLLRREPAPAGGALRRAGARSHILSRVSKLHGKALSFNNVLDLDSARALVDDFEQPACVIVKHNNPCGVAIGDDAARGLPKALRLRPDVAPTAA